MALNSTYGYDFYILYKNVRFVLPITPESFKITNDSNNEVINLINLGDVNIPKSVARPAGYIEKLIEKDKKTEYFVTLKTNFKSCRHYRLVELFSLHLNLNCHQFSS